MSSLAYLFFFITASTTLAQNNNKIPVSVYYESLCPDSIKFITQQLYPAWNSSLNPFMDLTLVPYGKANYTHTGNNYTFNCHHGEKECLGNKVQACALKKLQDMDMKVKYINCLMKMSKESKDDEYPTKQCATDLKIAADLSDSIAHCSTSDEGNEYLAALGNMTMQFQEPLRSVPSVVFNNRQNDKDKDATNNFMGVLCSYISGSKPAECTKNGASTVYPAAILVPLLFLISSRL